MSETVTTTIQYVDLEPNISKSGQSNYNFSLKIRGVTNDVEAANMTKWQPICVLYIGLIFPVVLPISPPAIPYTVTFAEAPIQLNVAHNGAFKHELHFTISKTILFTKFFKPPASQVSLKIQNFNLRPNNRELKITREIEVYIQNSNVVESDQVMAFNKS